MNNQIMSILIVVLFIGVITFLVSQGNSRALTPSPTPIFTPEPTPTPITAAKCYVGGCSGQICSDEEGAVSTCEYSPVYSCYKNAKCERQANGACGWTQTSELNACIRANSEVKL